jgi:hypothetical protein
MPIQSSGTINLSDVIEEFGNGTNNSVNLITTGSSGTVTAPVTGFVVIEVVGAGGGGGGSTSGGYSGGGGGSGAWAKELVYINSGETLNYVVGLGGNFGEGPGGPTNGQPGDPSYVYSGTKSITTIYCDGGGGGQTAVGTHGADGSGGDDSNANTNIGLQYAGNSGFDGVSGGNGGTAPQQISGATNAGNGGNGSSINGSLGQNGAIKFTWYETTKNIRSYLRSANTNMPDFVSNATVPTTGTMELRDFLGASAVGFKANSFDITADCGSTGTNNVGNCKLAFHANGRFDANATVSVGSGPGISVVEALDQQWCTANGIGGFEPRRLYVALFKTQGVGVDFEAGSQQVNTYIHLKSSPSTLWWNVFATGSDEFISGNLLISTTNSNTGLIANATVNWEVLAAGSN